jgi:hypothetical protein
MDIVGGVATNGKCIYAVTAAKVHTVYVEGAQFSLGVSDDRNIQVIVELNLPGAHRFDVELSEEGELRVIAPEAWTDLACGSIGILVPTRSSSIRIQEG